MANFQKTGFVLGLVIAAALTLLFIQSESPEPQSDPLSEVSVAEVGVQAESTLSKPLTEQPPTDRQLALQPPQDSAAAAGNAALKQSAAGSSVVEQAEQIQGSAEAQAGLSMGSDDALEYSEQLASLETVRDDVGDLPAMRLDKVFGPFDSQVRAKRFASTFANKTGFVIETEKAAMGGWYIVVTYSDDAQRQYQRRTLEDRTGLTLLPVE